jgi:hypothetical protein
MNRFANWLLLKLIVLFDIEGTERGKAAKRSCELLKKEHNV